LMAIVNPLPKVPTRSQFRGSSPPACVMSVSIIDANARSAITL
jgi:hypothetical protein